MFGGGTITGIRGIWHRWLSPETARIVTQEPESGLAYWERRAAQFGRRAVLNLDHAEEEFDAVTEKQKTLLFPALQRLLREDDRDVLDFGCGPGRFTPGLAELVNGHAVGIDLVQHLLDLAPHGPAVEYRLIKDELIPAPDASFDVAWVCLVMGGVPDAAHSAREIERVLRPGGLIFLVDNTHEGEVSAHYRFKPVDFYLRLFPHAPLTHLFDYEDVGERISVMAGRMMKTAD